MTRTRLATAAVAACIALSLALAGCASDDAAHGVTPDGRIAVVASTNVYGQIAEAIGGDAVQVTSIISNASQDPHEFEPSAADQLKVRLAGLLIENGGGYDPFLDAMASSSGATAPKITAAELSPHWPADGDLNGFNEHVFYDPATMIRVADAVAAELGKLDAKHAATFTANARTFDAGIATIQDGLAAIATAHAGATVFVTEPLPLYLTAAAGLRNVTPGAFSHAVEEGQDVPPATLLASLDLIGARHASVVITNAQAAGPETTEVEQKAQQAGTPVLRFSELLPSGTTYLGWMRQNVAALAKALDA